MNEALVSVVMPVYNGKKFVKEAIESVLKQTFTNFELIIVDDCSSDQTWSIIDKLARSDQRIKLLKNDRNRGVGYSLNRAIKRSCGSYLARMDADDMMAPTRLEKEVNFFKNHPKVVIVGSYMKEIDIGSRVIGQRTVPLNHRAIYQMMYYNMGIQNPTSMINKMLVPSNFGWNQPEGIKYGCDDLDLLFKLFQFGEFANLPEFLMYYRIHQNNLSLSHIKETFNEALNIRKNAVIRYHYKPTTKGKIISFFQQLVINFLPSQSLYLLYKISKKISI